MQMLNQNEIGEEILLTIVILILIILALWILRNSNLLNDNVDTNELDGGEWLNSHLKDLETNELDTLIKRGSMQKKEGYDDLRNNKN